MKHASILAVATINHNDEPRRIALHLHLDTDGAYRWYEADTEVSGPSVDAAKGAAARAWSGREWDIALS